MTPTARRRLGKYVLLGRLGAGGMGKIYLAHQPGPAGIEKLLVVKRLHSHLTTDPVLVASFLDEARLSMALNHPNIVHTYDVGDLDGRYFMVMEYIEGQNLGVILRMAKRSGDYPKSSTWAGIFLSVLDGLHAAHTAHDARGRPLQIIHRDVSPQNVLITYDGQTKLVDFGIAKAAMRVSETDAGTLKGKYAYMSPEQVRGDVLDARSDVFAAGIVLWEMLAGRRLYKADSIVRTV
ncbi:MAG TPA: serine/threonine-protein kinase, partial [Myxococcota bacterium]